MKSNDNYGRYGNNIERSQQPIIHEDKKFLSSNDKLFMNCFACTVLPPPNIPINESVKIRNYSERDRYYRIANELMKLKKIIVNDIVN
jgi:hypothetical protein